MNGEDKMNDCSDCKYFDGWDDSDGTPYCEYEKGIENCPYDNETEIKNNGIKAEYIERKALIERFKELGLGENSFVERMFADGVYSILEIFPSADVAPVMHGQWEPIINAYGGIDGCICKRCGIATKQKSNYCPNCGAKMDLED